MEKPARCKSQRTLPGTTINHPAVRTKEKAVATVEASPGRLRRPENPTPQPAIITDYAECWIGRRRKHPKRTNANAARAIPPSFHP